MEILEQLKSGIITSSPEETEALGIRLASALPPDSVIALTGDLGTGKTTLVRGIARGLGIDSTVTSPTYTIYTIYQGQRQLLHMDAYRLHNAHDLDSLTIDEFLRSPFLIALEWPENVPGFLDDYSGHTLQLTLLPDHRHQFKLTGH